jgi:DNA-directed RNA polymerase specialized sigma24 family protein
MTTHSTSATLLQRLRRPSDQDAWLRFVELYTPLMQHWASRRLGLADANDLVQGLGCRDWGHC